MQKTRINQRVLNPGNETDNAGKLAVLRKEYDARLNLLESKLIRCQSNETNDDHDNSIVRMEFLELLQSTMKANECSTNSRKPCNGAMFMALLSLLKIANENGSFDETDGMEFLVAQTIESCLRLSLLEDEKDTISTWNLSNSQVEYGICTMSSRYNNNDTSLLVSITLFVRKHIRELPPESTAQNIVGKILIPYISVLHRKQDRDETDQSKSTIPSPLPVKEIQYVCDALIALLQNQSHASAILAPLVKDVSIQFNYGAEEQVVNPLRKELLLVLLQRLETPHDQDNNDFGRIEEQAHVCRTLSASFKAIQKLKTGNDNPNSSRMNVDMQIIKPLQKFILEIVTKYNLGIRNTVGMSASFANLFVIVLQLLRTLISCYPLAMTGTGWKLVVEGANRNVTFTKSNSGFDGVSSTTITSSYLPLVLMTDNQCKRAIESHDIDLKQQAFTMDCVADIVMVLPWSKWLKQSVPSHNKHLGDVTTSTLAMTQTKGSTSGLYISVVDSLVRLICISKKYFYNCIDASLLIPLGRLIKSLLLEIPYCDSKLIRAGEELWEIIAKTTLNPNEQQNIAYSKEKQNLAYEVMVASSGGTVTPEGHLQDISAPARVWFLSGKLSSESFLMGLLDSIEAANSQFAMSVRILASILRTLPDIALQRWDAFKKVFDELISRDSTDKRELMLLDLLESFMLGRRDFDVHPSMKLKNDQVITDLDEIMLRQWNQKALQRCINIYSSFCSQDWMLLNRIDGRVSCHFDKILSHCRNSNTKTREGAAKAIGEFCTQYFTQCIPHMTLDDVNRRQHELFAYKVQVAMLELCLDKNAGVRSMSIFSLGNLANALKGSNPEAIRDTMGLHEIHKAILCALSDTNDKVVKNAIRSVGHTSNLLTLSMRRSSSCEHVSTSCSLLSESIECLTRKLKNTLDVALNEDKKTAMTWKERSAAKKHGWGACHSLGLVFEGLRFLTFEDNSELFSVCSKAAHLLLLCPCHYTALNEKVVLAAMAATCHLPLELLSQDNSEKIFLGNVLKISILIFESTYDNRVFIIAGRATNNKVTSNKFSEQNKKFLCHLLNGASVIDAIHVLSDERITSQTLGKLYSWMVERLQYDGLSARAFEIFALALQQPGRWSADIGLEQQFISRALQTFKQEQDGQSTSINSNQPSSMKDDDEADEL